MGIAPVAPAQESKRIYLPADASGVTISKIYPSTVESTHPSDLQHEANLEEYGRPSHRKSFKRIPSIAVVIKFHAPSQSITRPILRGALEEYTTSDISQRTVHFTQNLKSRSFKLLPRGRITSIVTVEDTSHCWQRSPTGNDFQYSYGCEKPLIQRKVETLAFDVVQQKP